MNVFKNIRSDALGQRSDEVEDIRIPTRRLDFLLRHLVVRFRRAEQNVESDCACVERRLLRHERNVFPVLLHIQLRDVLPIE